MGLAWSSRSCWSWNGTQTPRGQPGMGGNFTAFPFLPWTLSAEKWRDQEETGGGRCIRRGICAEEGKPPADLSLLLVLNPVIYSALLPPPAARGSCSHYCSSGDTDGNVSLSEKKKKSQLVCSAVGMCITRSTCVSFLHRSAIKH